MFIFTKIGFLHIAVLFSTIKANVAVFQPLPPSLYLNGECSELATTQYSP